MEVFIRKPPQAMSTIQKCQLVVIFGRDRRQQQLVSSKSRQTTISMPLPTPGGISRAGIYPGHYDKEHIQAANDGVSSNDNRGFGTHNDAMLYIIERWSHIQSEEGIRHVNENVPLEASNINNLCQFVREAMACSTSTNLKKQFYNIYLTPEVRRKREAASARMAAQRRHPEDSYDFLDQLPGAVLQPHRESNSNFIMYHKE